MGKFYLTNTHKFDKSASRVIASSGFEKNKKISINKIVLNVFKKKLINHENFFIDRNKNFVAVNGTLIYKEELGKAGLRNLLKEFNDKNISEIRENSIGHYVIIIKKNEQISVFCDKYGLYKVYYFIDEDRFIISNSYFSIVEAIENRELDLFALFEEVINEGCIGRENVFNGMYRLFGNEVLEINCSKNTIKVSRLEYERYPKLFRKNFDNAVRDYAHKVKYVLSVLSKNFKNNAILLTAGLDTRTVLAGLNSVNMQYKMMYGISKNPNQITDKEDLEAVKLFSDKYSKELYLMDWNDPCGPREIPDELFYKLDKGIGLISFTKSFLAELEGKIPNYPDLFFDGLFGETLKTRRWLEVQLFKKRISFKNLVKRYSLSYDLLRLFKDKTVKKEYIDFRVRKLNTLAREFKINLKNNKFDSDTFNEVRQIIARVTDNHALNIQNDFAFSLSVIGDLSLYEQSFNLPFKFRKDCKFQAKLIKTLDRSTLDVPIFTHQSPRRIDKKYNLVKRRITLWEFFGLNFLMPSRRLLTIFKKLSGRKRMEEKYYAQYINILKKDPIFSRYFNLNKIENLQLLDRMYTYSVMLRKYYYS